MTCLAGVTSVGGFRCLSGVHSGVCGVRGNLLGVALEEPGDFRLLFLGVCKEMLISVPKYHNPYSLLSILVLSKAMRKAGGRFLGGRWNDRKLISNSDTFPLPTMTQISLVYFFLAPNTESNLGSKTKNFLNMHMAAKPGFALNGVSLYHSTTLLFKEIAPSELCLTWPLGVTSSAVHLHSARACYAPTVCWALCECACR